MTRSSKSLRFERLVRLYDHDLPALTVRVARRYVRDFPDVGRGWLILGLQLVALARYEEAEQAFAKAIDLYPSHKQAIPLGQMGHLFREAGDYDQAAVWYRKAIEASPSDATGHIFLGGVLAKQGRFAEAEEAHRAAVACAEGCIDEAYLNLGFVLRARERFGEAAECFRKAIRLDPGYRAAKRALRDVKRCIALEGES